MGTRLWKTCSLSRRQRKKRLCQPHAADSMVHAAWCRKHSGAHWRAGRKRAFTLGTASVVYMLALRAKQNAVKQFRSLLLYHSKPYSIFSVACAIARGICFFSSGLMRSLTRLSSMQAACHEPWCKDFKKSHRVLLPHTV